MFKHKISLFLVSAALLTSCTAPATTNSNVVVPASNSNTAMETPSASGAAMETSATTGALTAEEVATHNSASDCYVIIENEVYDLTKFVNQHPGGPESIASTCGRDISAMNHPGGASMAEQIQLVPELKLGALAQ